MIFALQLRTVVAHQGGWDELLYFGIPVALALVAVRWAEQRAKAKRTGDREEVDDDAGVG